MGFYDNASQYFSDPNVSTGYTGIDNSGGTYWDSSAQNVSANDMYTDTDWAWSDDTWDNNWEPLFQISQDITNYDPASAINEASEKPWYNKAFDSPSAMSTLGALGIGAAKMISDRSAASDIRADREKERRWQEKQAELDRKHKEHLLEMQLAARESGGGGPDRPAPGKADNTTTALGANPVDWSKKRK